MSTVLENGLAGLIWSRQMTLGLLDEIADGQMCAQPFAGANHAMWIAGHLAWTESFFLAELGKRPTNFPAAWAALFGMGSEPKADRALYPSRAEVLASLAAQRELLVGWFRGMSPAQLESPLPAGWETFAPNYARLLTAIAWHEGLHGGQLTVVRKHLGIKPKFG